MAAARVPALGLSGVHDALSERFAMLTRGHRDATTRHRTLRNALDWSYRLLGETEQRVFRTLGVFAAGFTLDLAVALLAEGDAPGRWDVIDALTALIDHSLLVASADDPPRYHMLETMRAFALEQLATAGAEQAARGRASGALLAVVERFGAPGSATGDGAIRALCEAEMDNIRDALAWLRERDLALAARLAAQASFASTFSPWRNETTRWLLALEPALASAAGQALPRRPAGVLLDRARAQAAVPRRPAGACVGAPRLRSLASAGPPGRDDLRRGELGTVRGADR